MAVIRLKDGGALYGRIRDYNGKGKYLVVELEKEDGKPDNRLVSWDNVKGVYETKWGEGNK